MANRWCDGFGRYGGDETKMLNGSSSQAWAEISADWTLSTANPRTGSYHLRMDTSVGDGFARRVFGDQLTEVFVGFAVCAAALPNLEPPADEDASDGGVFLPRIMDQANVTQLVFVLGTDGAIAVYRGKTTAVAGALLGRTVPCIGAGAYQHIEIYAKAGTSDGAIEIRVDEVTRLNLTAINTCATANIEFSQATWGKFPNTGLADVIDLADVFVNDTDADGSGCDDFIGDCKSGVLMVNADTAQADFTLSTGVLGYALLDEIPPSESDYIETASTTAESDFGIENGPANLTEILTVRPFDRAFKDDAGTCLLAPNMISNSVKGTVDPQPIATAASYYDSNVPLDPDTDAPWTLSALNAALRAVERTA